MKTLKFASAAILAAAVMTSGALAQSQIFLKLPVIKGGVVVDGYEGQIDLLSTSYGLGVGDLRRTSCSAQPLSLAKEIDMATADIIMGAALGTAYPEATVTFVRPNGDGRIIRVLELALADVFITSYNGVGSAGGTTFTESVVLKYGSIRGTVYTRDDRGSETSQVFNVKCF